MPFPKDATQKDAPFYTLNGEEKKVELMHQQDDIQYAEFKSLEAKAIRLPFEQYVS